MKKMYLLVLLMLVSFCYGCGTTPIDDDDNDDVDRVVDTVPPLIQTSNPNYEVIEVGTTYDLLNGIMGLDNIDKLITDKITIDDDGFDSQKPGRYTVTYSLKDSSGNEADKVVRNIVVIDSKSAKLIAHRGGKGVGLENTKEAFLGAIEKGYYGLECDIQETKDGKLVVFHDLTIDRLASNGSTGNIKDYTWDQLKTIPLKKHETDGKDYSGTMLLFSEYLEIIKASSAVAFIELKETSTLTTVEKMFTEINSSGLSNDQYVIIANSSSLDELVAIRSSNQNVRLQYVARTNWKDNISRCLENKISLDIDYSTLIAEGTDGALTYIEQFHNQGLEVNVWVVNKDTDLKNALTLGVDYITTDSLIPNL